MRNVFVTGGAGYIGSHMCVELLSKGFNVIVLDNLSNSTKSSLEAVEKITQRQLKYIKGDVRNALLLSQIFTENKIDAVIHFAGLKSVGESIEDPLSYYDNNVSGTISLISAMRFADVKTVIFSSSATVYGMPDNMPITEDFPVSPINPYGRSKRMVEEVLEDLQKSDAGWRIALLRYFNPIGAHPSGEIGEDPNGVPNNLMPFVSQVAVGRRAQLEIFGNDYETPDGTGIRDYIHVVDLARGHLAALNYLDEHQGLEIFNLGTGTGYSVLDLVNTFAEVSGVTIPYTFVKRRAGDAAVSYADPGKADRLLNWRVELDLADMCRDAWRWQSLHPDGFAI